MKTEIKVEWIDHIKIKLTNSQGNTYTSNCEELMDFFHNAKESDRVERKYLDLYERVDSEMRGWAAARQKGISGIRVDKDYYALQWQSKVMRHEILKAKIQDRQPNWYNAPYLEIAEMEKRNKSYSTRLLP